MEKSPVKKQRLLIPAKAVLAGIFLAVALSVPFILRARTSFIGLPQAEYPPAATQSGSASALIPPLNNAATAPNGNSASSPELQTGSGESAAAARAVRSAEPVRLKIPALGIDTEIVPVGLTANGDMDTPKSAVWAGWFKYGSAPGESGSAVIAGHINTRYTSHGIFEHLADIQTGDDVYVTNAGGQTFHFTVTGKNDVAYNAPTESIFAKTGTPRLELITCDGIWMPAKHVYAERLVVSAELK